jgi:hypothetical protein
MSVVLDLAHALADHVSMDAPDEIVRSADRPPWLAMIRSRRTLRALGLLALAAIVVLAFGAYRQPDLLLNLVGLRYCG